MEKQVRFADGKINYAVKGNGNAVVLLHGFPENHLIWNEFLEKLSSKYLVVAIDLPGFGKSDVFGKNHSMTFMAEAVNAVMEKEEIISCVMVGHSMGGYVTLAFAREWPSKLNGIVLFHSHAGADDSQGKINRDRTIKAVESGHSAFIHEFIPSLFYQSLVSNYTDEIDRLRAYSMEASIDGITASLAGMRDRDDSLGLLAELKVPVFFIIGKNDSKIPLEIIIRQISLPANSEALILDNVGHMGFIEAKEITYKALENFIERTF